MSIEQADPKIPSRSSGAKWTCIQLPDNIALHGSAPRVGPVATEPRRVGVASGIKTQPTVITEADVVLVRPKYTEQIQISALVLIPLATARGSVPGASVTFKRMAQKCLLGQSCAQAAL